MVTSLHNGVTLKILTPDLGGPVTNSKEVLEVARVSLYVVDGTMMLTLLKAKL